MSVAKHITCEITVIGTGMAGMAAALFAANRGLSTALVGCTGEIIFASGFLDLLGVHPIEKKQIWSDPWAGIDALVSDIPNHPYARLTEKDFRLSLDEFIGFLGKAGLPYQRHLNRNVRVLTPMGTTKPTYAVPQSMWNGVLALEKKTPCLILDIQGLKGFSARLIAENMRDIWPNLETGRISLQESGQTGDLYPERIAQQLELEQNREKLSRLVGSAIKNAGVVGMPAIFGLYQTADVFSDLEKRIGIPLFEIPTMPPSIPGLRIKEAFEQRLANLGVKTFFQRTVLRARHETNNEFVLDIGDTASKHILRTHAVILASGRFLGRGLHAERKHIRETIFDLPVYQPADRASWHRNEFLDPRGHPINQAGLEIDDHFRPLDRSGRPAFPALFAAGSILAHQDWMRQKCGAGLAIASAYGAVSAFLKLKGKS